MDTIYNELKSLCSIPALSGGEDLLIADLITRLKGFGCEPYVDRVGNVTVTFEGTQTEEPSILFFGHIDELGLVVRGIDADGFVRVERVGGIPEKTLPGSFVDVHTLDKSKSYIGLFGCSSHHVTPPEKKMLVPSIKEMYIDLGCESKEEVKALGIDVGSAVTYAPVFHKLGPHRLTAKALDNRMGVYVLLRLAGYLASDPPGTTVHICFSIQEEFNSRGCLPVFDRLRPAAAICLDITPACDTPELKNISETALGKGPAVLYYNFHGRGTLGGLIPNPKLTAFIRDTAKANEIPLQNDVILGVLTDDAFTQFVGPEGVAMAHISVPLRYTHAPVETIDLRDLEQCSQLCNAIAVSFGKDVDLARGI